MQTLRSQGPMIILIKIYTNGCWSTLVWLQWPRPIPASMKQTPYTRLGGTCLAVWLTIPLVMGHPCTPWSNPDSLEPESWKNPVVGLPVTRIIVPLECSCAWDENASMSQLGAIWESKKRDLTSSHSSMIRIGMWRQNVEQRFARIYGLKRK